MSASIHRTGRARRSVRSHGGSGHSSFASRGASCGCTPALVAQTTQTARLVELMRAIVASRRPAEVAELSRAA